jgi:hypothetical protein
VEVEVVDPDAVLLEVVDFVGEGERKVFAVLTATEARVLAVMLMAAAREVDSLYPVVDAEV